MHVLFISQRHTQTIDNQALVEQHGSCRKSSHIDFTLDKALYGITPFRYCACGCKVGGVFNV